MNNMAFKFSVPPTTDKSDADIWGYNLAGEVAHCCPEAESDRYSEGDYSNAKGRRKACKAKGLKGKAFRKCLKGLRKEDKGKPKHQLKKIKKTRKKEWKKVKKDVKRQWRAEGKGFFRKAWRVFAKVNPLFVVMRNSYLALTRMNMFGIATKFKNMRNAANKGKKKQIEFWDSAKIRWQGFGGNTSSLEKAIEAGYKKKPKISKVKVKTSFDGSREWSILDEDRGEYWSNVLAETIIGSASAVLAVMLPLLKGSGNDPEMDEETYENIGEMGLEQIDQTDELTEEQKEVVEAIIEEAEEAGESGRSPDEEEDDKIMGIPKTGFWIGVAVLSATAIGVTIWAVTKKK